MKDLGDKGLNYEELGEWRIKEIKAYGNKRLRYDRLIE